MVNFTTLLALASVVASSPVTQSDRRLISLAPGQEKWMSDADILDLMKSKTDFVDMTEGNWKILETAAKNNKLVDLIYPASPAHQDLINTLIKDIDQAFLKSFLQSFSKFYTRYYKSFSGEKSAEWLYKQVEGVFDASKRSDLKLSVKKVEHSFKQFSIIARIESKTNAKSDVVILGAHQDSINQMNPRLGRAPGVDDDATGCATNLQVLKLLLGSEFVPSRPIEFHFYAGEEAGLLGSQAIAADYAQSKKDVYAMLQSDMTGYAGSGKVMTLVTDYVSKPLTDSVRMIAETYSDLQVIDTKCGYACSDHASWTKGGFPSAFHFESKFEDDNKKIHSSQDQLEYVSLDHVAEFVKSSLGFVVEMSLF